MKGAFRNDWEQTKHDFGSDRARDLDQDVPDTIRQMGGGSEETFERHEPAFRFGHAARRNFGAEYANWNGDLEARLRSDYGENWNRDRDYVRWAYDYRYPATGTTPTRPETRPNR
ncbi:MAG: hypothetical protein ACRD2J_15495 [Thermoanaerobaculia bacterium]